MDTNPDQRLNTSAEERVLLAQLVARTIQSQCFHVMRRRQTETLGKGIMQRTLACSRDSTKIGDGENIFRLIMDCRQSGLQHARPLAVADRSKAEGSLYTGAGRAADLPAC